MKLIFYNIVWVLVEPMNILMVDEQPFMIYINLTIYYYNDLSGHFLLL
jgi:hypothetical protein